MIPVWLAAFIVAQGLAHGHTLIGKHGIQPRNDSPRPSGTWHVAPEVWVHTAPWHIAAVRARDSTARVTVHVVLRGLDPGIVIVRREGRVVWAGWDGGSFTESLEPGGHEYEATAAGGRVGRASVTVYYKTVP